MNLNNLIWLESWAETVFSDNNYPQVEIYTLDNPAWAVFFNLSNTNLSDREIPILELNRNENDWLYISKISERFNVACGTKNLCESINLFAEWASEHQSKYHCAQELTWLQDWYESQCDGSWESTEGVIIKKQNMKWSVIVSSEKPISASRVQKISDDVFIERFYNKVVVSANSLTKCLQTIRTLIE